jgi:hypothetical protein
MGVLVAAALNIYLIYCRVTSSVYSTYIKLYSMSLIENAPVSGMCAASLPAGLLCLASLSYPETLLLKPFSVY